MKLKLNSSVRLKTIKALSVILMLFVCFYSASAQSPEARIGQKLSDLKAQSLTNPTNYILQSMKYYTFVMDRIALNGEDAVTARDAVFAGYFAIGDLSAVPDPIVMTEDEKAQLKNEARTVIY